MLGSWGAGELGCRGTGVPGSWVQGDWVLGSWGTGADPSRWQTPGRCQAEQPERRELCGPSAPPPAGTESREPPSVLGCAGELGPQDGASLGPAARPGRPGTPCPTPCLPSNSRDGWRLSPWAGASHPLGVGMRLLALGRASWESPGPNDLLTVGSRKRPRGGSRCVSSARGLAVEPRPLR